MVLYAPPGGASYTHHTILLRKKKTKKSLPNTMLHYPPPLHRIVQFACQKYLHLCFFTITLNALNSALRFLPWKKCLTSVLFYRNLFPNFTICFVVVFSFAYSHLAEFWKSNERMRQEPKIWSCGAKYNFSHSFVWHEFYLFFCSSFEKILIFAFKNTIQSGHSFLFFIVGLLRISLILHFRVFCFWTRMKKGIFRSKTSFYFTICSTRAHVRWTLEIVHAFSSRHSGATEGKNVSAKPFSWFSFLLRHQKQRFET